MVSSPMLGVGSSSSVTGSRYSTRLAGSCSYSTSFTGVSFFAGSDSMTNSTGVSFFAGSDSTSFTGVSFFAGSDSTNFKGVSFFTGSDSTSFKGVSFFAGSDSNNFTGVSVTGCLGSASRTSAIRISDSTLFGGSGSA